MILEMFLFSHNNQVLQVSIVRKTSSNFHFISTLTLQNSEVMQNEKTLNCIYFNDNRYLCHFSVYVLL